MKKFLLLIIIVIAAIGLGVWGYFYLTAPTYGYVDSEGKLVFNMQHGYITLCDGDGGVCVSVKKGLHYNNYDKNGKLLFESKYPCEKKIGDYYTYYKPFYKFGAVMDKTGKVLSKHEGEISMNKFLGCDVAFYRLGADAMPYCVNITAKANNTKDILENIIFLGGTNAYNRIYFTENGKYGLYDFDGNVIAKPIFSKPVENVYNNMFIQGNVLIDEKENVLFEPENYYDKKYKDDNVYETKFNIIDKKLYITFYNYEKKKYVTYTENEGKFEDTGFSLKQIETQPVYSEITSFANGDMLKTFKYDRGLCDKAFCYKYKGKMLVTDLEGNTVINGDYDELRSYEAESKTCIVKKYGKYGVVGKDNNVIMPFVYDNIDFVTHNNSLFAVNGKSGIEMDGYLIHGENVCLVDGKGKNMPVRDIFVNDEYAYINSKNNFIIYDMNGKKVTDSEELIYAETINKSSIDNADDNIREEIIKKNNLNKKEADIIRHSDLFYSPYGYVIENSKNSRGEGVYKRL